MVIEYPLQVSSSWNSFKIKIIQTRFSKISIGIIKRRNRMSAHTDLNIKYHGDGQLKCVDYLQDQAGKGLFLVIL